jgi:hypothetical protein
MKELLALLAVLGVPAALVTLVVLAALTASRSRSRTPRRHGDGLRAAAGPADPAARQAWMTAYMAHVRLARLEHRVHALEAHSTSTGGDHR